MIVTKIKSPIFYVILIAAMFTACSKSPKLEPEVLSSQGPPGTVSDSQKVTLSPQPGPYTISETGSSLITINFDKPAAYAMNLNWSLPNTAATDWATLSGTVHVSAGSSSTTILVKPINDNIYEPIESYDLIVSSTMALNSLTLALDLSSEEAIPVLSLQPTLVNENDSGVMIFVISRPSYQAIIIDYSIASGTAVFGTDFSVPLGQTGTLTIPAGATSVSLPWSATEEAVVETLTETATLTASKNILSGDITINAGVGNTTQVFTVYDNDLATVDVHIATPSQTVSENVGSVSVTLMLNKASATIIDYAYSLSGSAIAGQDYIGAPGVVRFQPGDISKTINIPIINDDLPELSNTLSFSKYMVTGTPFSSGPLFINITILDDDGIVTPNIATPTITVAENVGTLLAPFSFDRAAGDAIVLKYTISGTAKATHDYTNSFSYTVPAGTINGNISIPILDDGRDELDETLIVTLIANASEYTLGTDLVFTATITDNDSAPTLSLLPVTQKEGCEAVFYAKLNTPVGYDVTFNYSTSSGTATSGTDFTSSTGTRTIPAGRQGIGIRVPIFSDGSADSDETFSMTISNVSAPVTLGTATANGTIKESIPSFAATTQIKTFSTASATTTFGKNSCYTIAYGILSGSYDASLGFLYYMNLFAGEAIPISDEGESYNQVNSFPSDDSRIFAWRSRTASFFPPIPSDLIAIDIDGHNKVNVTPSGAGFYSNMSMTNDGQKIMFQATASGSPRAELYLIDTRGSAPSAPHVNCGPNTGCTSPIFSNNTIVFWSDARTASQYELYSQGVSNVTATKLHSDLPAGRSIKVFTITNDQSKILFSSDKDNATAGVDDLFSVNLDGTGEVKINTLANQGVRSFAISANSQKVSWVQELGKTIIANLDGTSQIQIGSADGTHGLSTLNLPKLLFSPNGNYVAACLYDNISSQFHMFSYKSDGTGEVALKNNAATVCTFAFTTDSLQIVYTVRPSTYSYGLISESVTGGTESTVTDTFYNGVTIIDVGSSSGYVIYQGGDSFSYISSHYKKRKLDGTATGLVDFTPPLASALLFALKYTYDNVNNIFQWSSGAGPYIRNSN